MEEHLANCSHPNLECLNHYEFIRKYLCVDCKHIMMCECEEDIGNNYLSHQIHKTSRLDDNRQLTVTLGFQKDICNKCRQLPETPYPLGQIYGRSSKFLRYYWREIFFLKVRKFGNWCKNNNINDWFEGSQKHPDILGKFEQEAIDELKTIFETYPKYNTKEPSSNDIIEKYNIEVETIKVNYLKNDERKLKIKHEGELLTVEGFAKQYLRNKGYEVLILESRPFHALFGIMLYQLIQDHQDPNVRLVYFGERSAYEKDGSKIMIPCLLPEDFATKGYYKRREKEIQFFLNTLQSWHIEDSEETKKEHLLWTFDYWIHYSESLRQYLWAHREDDVMRARKIIELFPAEQILKILDTLLKGYWERYLGWPDLLAYNDHERIFIEVKSSKDKLSNDQKNWIIMNFEELRFNFKILKLIGPKINPL